MKENLSLKSKVKLGRYKSRSSLVFSPFFQATNDGRDISAKRLKCDFSQPPDPSNKFKPIEWRPLIVDKTKVEKTILERLEKRLKRTFPTVLEENILKINDDVINKLLDNIIPSAGGKLFNFIMAEQMEFYKQIGEEMVEAEKEEEETTDFDGAE